ncbi:FG-GAP repeat protein [Photobacterium sp. OFAV2-7]|uniref:FG-GAP repeat protein n=1 Tax=Photobacterium sp. OFAV2-7 TaxID=2917748 RepID=UPI001EF66C4C|nr:FG-GAP repeat protein [Photobacterium sp. OFAV2-7]MCG7584753.1 FG-GAP repeat protein [Photobacterium sp. OFAV2-7]
MKKLRFTYWLKLSFLAPLALIFFAGCSDDDQSGDSPSISPFNLTMLSAADTDVKKMTLIWTSASDDPGVIYSVCEKDTSKDNVCNVLTTVTDSLNATISVPSLVDALTTDYFIIASNSSGKIVLSNEKNLNASAVAKMIGYYKASNTGEDDGFGYSMALSGDGTVLAVGARDEDNGASGIITDGSETTDTGAASNAGAVYLFSNNAGSWVQTAYVKASNTDSGDFFGYSVALSSDGTTLAVGAPDEDNDASGVIIDGSEITDTGSAPDSGAVYLFSNSTGNWMQTAYVKASNTGAYDEFGQSVALSGDGTTLTVAALGEDNGATGVITDGSETTDTGTALGSGAVYLFSNSSSNWAQTAYVKASNTGSGDFFGYSLALSGDGTTLAVGARDEDNGATGVITDGSEITDTGAATNSGAAYLYSNSMGSWVQTAYVKASNTEDGDNFGSRLALSGDGTTLAVGAPGEDNGATGVITDGSEVTDRGLAPSSGAVYLFSNNTGNWVKTAYIKATNADSNDYFGSSLAFSGDGAILAVGGYGEDNGATGIITDGSENTDTESATNSGAVYLFRKSEANWGQTTYVKASNSGVGDFFGKSVALSNDATTLAVGATNEDNGVTGIITDGSETIDTGAASNSGTVYLY